MNNVIKKDKDKNKNEYSNMSNEELFIIYKNEKDFYKKKKIKDQLILNNLKLVSYVIKDININFSNLQYTTYDDLFQDGVIGLISSIDKYNIEKGNFSTYSVFWIKRFVYSSLDFENFIRIPKNLKQEIFSISKKKNIFFKKYGRYPKIDEICKIANIIENRYFFIKHVANIKVVSLDEQLNLNDEDFLLFQKYLTDEQNLSVEDEIVLKNNNELLSIVLDILNEKEKIVIEKRFGIKNNTPMTLDQISKELGVSRERIRQIEYKALRRLRVKADKMLDNFDFDEYNGKNSILN